LGIAAKTQSEEIDPRPGTTIGDLVLAAAARNGDEFARLVLDADGALRSSLLIALDGDQIQDPAETPLPDSARELTLLPPIAGG
ncbi:MAG: MoaD/ThiS family protein, partial [Verrucomicrobiales bacterium]